MMQSIFSIVFKEMIRIDLKEEIVKYMEDDLALRYVRIYPGVNSRAELIN